MITMTSAYFNAAGSVNHLRASNLITYTTPANASGFSAMLSMAPSETVSTAPPKAASAAASSVMPKAP